MKGKKYEQELIGRDQEQRTLDALFQSKKAEFIAVYGRRRVGKTFLIKHFFEQKDSIFFYVTGIKNGKLNQQLSAFTTQLGVIFYSGASIKLESSWFAAFEALTKAIDTIINQRKVILFFDEFPWMATKRSGLLDALDYYWNRHWTHLPNLKLIICGSSASWIIEKIINNKGGLHNRVTRHIRLEPFSLKETQAFLKINSIPYKSTQVLDIYMAFGGVPHYLSLISKHQTAHQAIDTLCFQKNGELVKEFDRLFDSLFTDGPAYALLVTLIGKNRYGVSQADLMKENNIASGGRAIKRLKDLEEAGFIQSYIPYGHREKGIYYKIIDEYCLFYLYWIKPSLKTIQKQYISQGYWLSKAQSVAWKSWAGYSFEAICYKHTPNIRQALGISVGAEIGHWRYSPRKKEEDGCQIDLLFDRDDDAITLCEIKYNGQPFVIDKAYAKILQNKVNVYQKITHTNKQLFLVMITVNEIKPTMYSEELIQATLTLNDLFK